MSYYDNNHPNGNSNHSLAHINWGTIVFLYIIWWPIGLILTILKIVDMQAEKKEQQGRDSWLDQLNGRTNIYGNYNAGGNAYSYRTYPGAAPNAAAPNASAAQYARQRANSGPANVPPAPQASAPQPGSAPNAAAYRAPYTGGPTQEQQKAARAQRFAIAGLVIAAVFAFLIGVPEVITAAGLAGYGLLNSYNILHSLLPGLLKILAGAGLAFVSARMSRSQRSEKVLATIVGSRNSVSLRELSSASGFNNKKTIQLTRDAIQHGLFGPYSYIDMAAQMLVVRGAPPKSAAPAKETKAAAAAPNDENKYQAILRQLHEANDRIPGEEMSEKISQLETLSARIFDLAEKDPAKKPQLNKFMDYYLPTALKLLNTYATLDQQGMEGQNISDTKASIEHAMDLLVTAFEAQLDKLFQNDALDVSGDVAALQSMMSMDGLTDTDFNVAMGSPTLDFPKENADKKDGKA